MLCFNSKLDFTSKNRFLNALLGNGATVCAFRQQLRTQTANRPRNKAAKHQNGPSKGWDLAPTFTSITPASPPPVSPAHKPICGSGNPISRAERQSKPSAKLPGSCADLIQLLSSSRSPRTTQGVAGQERLSRVWPGRNDLDAFLFPI